jgi:hypothetical protein
MSKQSEKDSTDGRPIKHPTLILSCKTCGNDSLSVGINPDHELIVFCQECDLPVAVFTKWPDDRLVHGSCDTCGKDVNGKKRTVN